MNKLFLVLFISLVFISLFIITNPVLARTDPACAGPDGKFGIVTCGCGKPIIGPDGKCMNCCEIEDFFVLFARIYDFIVKYVATTLAVIMITVGATFMMISAGNPNLASTGKNMVKYAIIGLILVFGSWLIINALLKLIGYQGNWANLP